MNWDNDQLISLIQHKSKDLNFLQTQRPQIEEIENNPLIENRVQINAVKLRLKLDKIKDTDTSPLVRDIADSIELSSNITPIPSNYTYTDYEIDQFLTFHDNLEKWQKENSKIERIVLGRDNKDLEPFTMVIDTRINKPILMFSGNNNCRSIGLNEFDNVIGEHIAQYSDNFAKMTEEQINTVLEDINFDSLRKRLVNGGYDKLVSSIDNELVERYL